MWSWVRAPRWVLFQGTLTKPSVVVLPAQSAPCRAKCSMPRKALHAAQSTPCPAKYLKVLHAARNAPCRAKCSMPRKLLHAAQSAPCRKIPHAAKCAMPQSAPCLPTIVKNCVIGSCLPIIKIGACYRELPSDNHRIAVIGSCLLITIEKQVIGSCFPITIEKQVIGSCLPITTKKPQI